MVSKKTMAGLLKQFSAMALTDDHVSGKFKNHLLQGFGV